MNRTVLLMCGKASPEVTAPRYSEQKPRLSQSYLASHGTINRDRWRLGDRYFRLNETASSLLTLLVTREQVPAHEDRGPLP